MTADRRQPVARYVVFADEATQEQFGDVAEEAYRDLARLDQWTGQVPLVLSAPETAKAKRRLLRRAVPETHGPPETVNVTGALAAAGETGRDVPGRVGDLDGCAAERKLAATMGDVVLDLTRDLAREGLAEQRAHPAYRQTLRLAAELRALHTVLVSVGCSQSSGCVHLRQPEHWGRRAEDVEIAEVRAVLVELAAHAEG
ncbi:hypothetical protein [Nocardioides sp. CER19]|uniref:hypothetical protein n=1 Tax=Nocardioides sp. CER19 TaxID=3038538 RepID=UPI00244B39F4|nr:hypothetical protein [Nocardioides sp. CER19]MDH2414678.1 hypothetical protein [Nocardioides sp. CER19]